MWKNCFSRLPLAPAVREYSSAFPHATSLPKLVSFLTPTGHHFLNCALSLDPDERISAGEALKHPFWTERPLPQPISLEKVGMVTYFDEKQLEVEAEVMSVPESRNKMFKKFSKFAKKD